MARFLLDENMPKPTLAALRAAGLDVEDVRDVGLRGKPDAEILVQATAHGQVVVTRDLDFGNTKVYPLGSHAGVVVLRLPNEATLDEITQRLVSALRLLADDDLLGNLVVLDAQRLRIRRKP